MLLLSGLIANERLGALNKKVLGWVLRRTFYIGVTETGANVPNLVTLLTSPTVAVTSLNRNIPRMPLEKCYPTSFERKWRLAHETRSREG